MATDEAGSHATPADVRKARILIVDDVEVNRDILTDLVEDLGYDSITACDGIEAMEKLHSFKPDIVLLDLLMPRMNGLETLAEMRRFDEFKLTPVVVVSAVDNMADIINCINMGADDYLIKPFETEMLFARVRACLEKKRMIDEQQRLNRDLAIKSNLIEKQHEELLDAQKARDKFFQIVAHDLRCPLGAIMLSTDLLEMEAETGLLSDVDLKDRIDIVKKNTQLMKALVDDFLDYEKILEGEITVHLTGLNLDSFVESLIPALQVIADNHEITLTTESTPGLPDIQADCDRLHQVFNNYITNAIKFSPNGSEIKIRTVQRGDRVRLEVRDAGPGIPADERSELFKEFVNISTRKLSGEKGSGLGLSIVKKLVEIQGGTVGAEFPDAGGSIFWFEFPA